MLWVLLALFAGVSKTTKTLCTKYATTFIDQYSIAFSVRAVTVLVAALPAAITWQARLDVIFWVALLGNGFALAAATVTSTRAFKYGDVSTVAPLIGLAPLAILLPSVFVFGDVPTPTAALGIILVAIGGYTLELDDIKKDALGPFKALAADRGARYAILTILLVMFIPNLDALGVARTNPFVWAFLVHAVATALLLPLLFVANTNFSDEEKETRTGRRWVGVLALVGVANASIIFAQLIAYQLTLPVYVIAVKRFNLVLSVYLGARFFGEEGLRSRLTGAILIALGVVTISLASAGLI